MSRIYKLLERSAWLQAVSEGSYAGSSVDLADGFIHFSTAAQVAETARRHFHGVGDLVLLAVDSEALGAPVTWEPSRGGALFPHLYGVLPIRAVVGVRAVDLDGAGAPVIGTLES
jgi:uncharacterized protein (DUF952 family)